MLDTEVEYKTKKNRREQASYFLSTLKINRHEQIFERLEDDEGTLASRIVEGYKWSSGKAFKLTVSAIEISLKEREDAISYAKSGLDVGQRKKYISELLSRLRSRGLKEIPTEPGLCFDEGFLARKAQGEVQLENDEEFKAGVSFKAHPDVSFDLKTYTSYASDTTFLDNKDLDKLIAQNNGRVLRKGSVNITGISQAEEWLAEGETDDGNPVNGKRLRGHYFVLEANSMISSPLTPKFRITMRTGESILVDDKNTTTGATLSDAQAIALWDAVSKTLRPRPSAF
jgi:Tle cognate immunity protein 4 C-terminal domain